MLSVVLFSAIMLSVVLLSAIKLSVVLLSVIMMSVEPTLASGEAFLKSFRRRLFLDISMLRFEECHVAVC
jgi:hypothetical protein